MAVNLQTGGEQTIKWQSAFHSKWEITGHRMHAEYGIKNEKQ
jgi:hypothetical protein